MTSEPDPVTLLAERCALLQSRTSDSSMWINQDLALAASQFPSCTALPLQPQPFYASLNAGPWPPPFTCCWPPTHFLGLSLDTVSWCHLPGARVPFQQRPACPCCQSWPQLQDPVYCVRKVHLAHPWNFNTEPADLSNGWMNKWINKYAHKTTLSDKDRVPHWKYKCLIKLCCPPTLNKVLGGGAGMWNKIKG